jgi:integrase/recombinase XerD
MKNQQTFGIAFFLKKDKSRNNKAPIYARITVDGCRVDLSTKMDVLIENWNEEKGMVKGNKDEIRSLRKYLEGFRARIVESYQDLQLQKVPLTAQAIKEAVTGQKSTPSRTLVGLIQYHNTRMKDSLEPGTMKNYFTTQRYLQRFLTEQLKIKDIPLSELTYPFLLNFEQFIKRAPDRTHRYTCSQNGAMKHIERIKKMIRLAMDHEWLEKDPFQKFKLQIRKTTREFLTPSELATIESKPIQIPRLRQVRDLFIFSCYSGLAYIDVMQLTPDNIALGIDGEPWLHIRRQKSDEPMSIPLLPPAIALTP